MKINVIGAGLAGSEAAYFLASHGVEVFLYDQKPTLGPAFHEPDKCGELVCSNSLKSVQKDNASGLLKAEMQEMGSLVMEAAYKYRLPSGQDLAVDREAFSAYITEKIKANPLIHRISARVDALEEKEDVINLVCTGPLTEAGLMDYFKSKYGAEFLSFFDAAAPLVYFDSLDISKMYFKSRYDKGEGKYLNVPLNQEQYYSFAKNLASAQKVELHDFDHFEGCLPVETMAERGIETLRFGPLKPKGLSTDTIHPFAVVQLRQDDVAGSLYNLVGFQTNLTYPEQRRVLSSLPGFEKVRFARYGLMHRNSYLNAPSLLSPDLSLKNSPNTFIGGQFSGVEGYVESASSGLLAAYYILQRVRNKPFNPLPIHTMLGSLINYLLSSSPKRFAPMNACYGIYQYPFVEDKEAVYNNSIEAVKGWVKENS
ncbi:MAG: methylenetetrahydrofolate--tRNA-(uracil(54)-C(5))-methyltransferase (FADH(2)-oxidizing) TrmFO [Bacilli bacterium]|jgi:methylenetetrahydrofolate--tRNA-(uracil-5-)-methyltransferase|nr:methylenetetrahydrofolate--tRNA-(uracil(54)-C(5))-methyltransferase (FADH(2)-oxidizing) TrmFO [Bacilli bacterium]